MSMQAEFETLIATLGVPAALVQNAGTTVMLARIGLATAKPSDPIVNSYGVGAQTITMPVSGLGAVVPTKFDRVKIGTSTMVLEHVNPIHDVGTGAIIGYKGFVKGKP